MDSDRWVVEVARDVCVGSGVCSAMAPDYFELRQGRSIPVRPTVGAEETVLEAAGSCPVEAILVRHAVTGEVLAPDA
ncbi:MAG TPA: ferredoxin [Micromonosporaceae bacterium]|nr:ferredoxin [Micromonosporaceae bacterium]